LICFGNIKVSQPTSVLRLVLKTFSSCNSFHSVFHFSFAFLYEQVISFHIWPLKPTLKNMFLFFQTRANSASWCEIISLPLAPLLHFSLISAIYFHSENPSAVRRLIQAGVYNKTPKKKAVESRLISSDRLSEGASVNEEAAWVKPCRRGF